MDATSSFTDMEANAADAAALLKALANDRRLMVLCRLADAGELPVGALVDASGLSQSALSQHLARLRDEGLVATRRDGQTVYYRIADARAEKVLGVLNDLYCVE